MVAAGRWQLVASAAVIAVVACGGGGKRRLTNGKLDVYAAVPANARIEPVTETDASGGHGFIVRVHLDAQVHVDIAHYPRPCDLAGYQQAQPSAADAAYIKLLGAEKRADGYAIRVETNLGDGPQPVLGVETCSTKTQTLCKATMPLGDRVHERAVASLCDSLRAED